MKTVRQFIGRIKSHRAAVKVLNGMAASIQSDVGITDGFRAWECRAMRHIHTIKIWA